MLLTHIKADFFKTYRLLDLDLSVAESKPIILIGGANGGGKTSLFQAIYGALYGLDIANEKAFFEYYNSGINSRENASEQTIRHITLEIHFLAETFNENKPHSIQRRYELGSQAAKKSIVEYVTANFGGSKYAFNSAQKLSERQKHQTEIAKIIKANLPEELSHYFLFDALESSALTRDDAIGNIIKENIENVMGFRKYIQLSRVADSLAKRSNAEKLRLQKERDEYLRLVGEERQIRSRLESLDAEIKQAEEFRKKNQTLYNALKTDLDSEIALTKSLDQIKKNINTVLAAEQSYTSLAENFLQNFERNVLLPNLARSLSNTLKEIFTPQNGTTKTSPHDITPELLDMILAEVTAYLQENFAENFATNFSDYSPERANHQVESVLGNQSLTEALKTYILGKNKETRSEQSFAFLSSKELRALEFMQQAQAEISFTALLQKKSDAERSLEELPDLEQTYQNLQNESVSKDFSMLRLFERNETTFERAKEERTKLDAELTILQSRISAFDIQESTPSSPRENVIQKLKPFFKELGETLLQSKKRQIEQQMMQDLNINLVPYRGVIDRIEIADSLGDLSFKIFHVSGNEINLNQLNTASKQIVVQCLLKALHEFGEFNPPVMIDTVMGALDEASRQSVLENYFPELSHQTILLSSDSEIRPEKDFATLKPFISRAYTLKRNKEQQETTITEGYFGLQT